MKRLIAIIFALFIFQLSFSQTSTSNFIIGTGIADVTYPTFGVGMHGMADDLQKTTEVETPLYARAFIIADKSGQKRIAIIVIDILTCKQAVKTKVIEELQNDPFFNHQYNVDNVLISGTHTHSAPVGYSDYFLYNFTGGGFDQMCFDHIVKGIVEAMRKAHQNLAPGNIYFNKGGLSDCGRNRSVTGYNNNPIAEQNNYSTNTDTVMLSLKFVKNNNGNTKAIGVLNWYSLHPTSRGQTNTLITGDNFGWASHLFENEMATDVDSNETFVCAFANETAGDVSGNIKYGLPDGGPNDILHMQEYGNMLYSKSKELFNTATDLLDTGISYSYTHIDMSNDTIDSIPNARTWPAAVGLSMAAGSTEDSKGNTLFMGISITTSLREGITSDNITLTENGKLLIAYNGLVGKLPSGWNLPGSNADINLVNGHYPKPIMWPVGKATPYPLVPNVVPIQLIKIGKLAIAGIPGEMTTMAGRRLRTSIHDVFGSDISEIALNTYANAYSYYITTKEEYEIQNYEGAVTIYGPYTLAAYQQEYTKLAKAIKYNTPIDIGSPAIAVPPDLPYPGIDTTKIFINNRSDTAVRIRVYKSDDTMADTILGIPSSDKTVEARTNALIDMPSGYTTAKVRKNDDLSVIYQGGSIIIVK
ncbi:MAG TPA: neutral/alkaline non-lysosomal ceramidase N-terminal domain-containing protein [Bacteroidales bacterium]|nr:neutral/alkaline non-lysosomal ceramidase N-terminal domain-containing protein [Bacteroidales bacterium]HPS16873.1 neutral/alkaline non-lysosomal ceramidase N-terminal domain-containing protein [Bacteroidales bacterium]